MTVVASILDGVSSENVPVRLISNTPPEQYGDTGPAPEAGDGGFINIPEGIDQELPFT